MCHEGLFEAAVRFGDYIGSLHLCIFIIFDGGSLMAETEGIWPENT